MGSIPSETPSKCSIIVVGAGIGGLAAAVALSRKGHEVLVLESKPELNEFGASIGISANGTKVLKAWGLEEKFRPVVTENRFGDIRDGLTNERLGRIIGNIGHTSEMLYGSQNWSIHRADYQQVLAQGVKENGAKIMFDANVVSVDTSTDHPTVVLHNGQRLTADLVVGADGMRSAVRSSISATASAEPKKLQENCWRATVPKDKIRNNPKLKWLLESGNSYIFTVPGAYILTWPLPTDRPYDVVASVTGESAVPAGVWGIKDDPDNLRSHFQHFCPEVRELLDQIDQCINWALAELDPLETCRSENGSIVLLGDAFHAMIPHSGSGGNSAIEDGAVLGECVEWAFTHGRSIGDATRAYEAIRKPRVERIQRASHEGFSFLSASGETKVMRDKALREQVGVMDIELAKSEQERRKQPQSPPDMNARFPSLPYMQWLQGYDAIADAKTYLAEEMK